MMPQPLQRTGARREKGCLLLQKLGEKLLSQNAAVRPRIRNPPGTNRPQCPHPLGITSRQPLQHSPCYQVKQAQEVKRLDLKVMEAEIQAFITKQIISALYALHSCILARAEAQHTGETHSTAGHLHGAADLVPQGEAKQGMAVEGW